MATRQLALDFGFIPVVPPKSNRLQPWQYDKAMYYKFNGFLTYSQGGDADGFSFTARGYHGTWDSSDQIADNAVPLVGFFGTLNPTDGGNSQRNSLQTEWHRQSRKFRVEPS